MAEPSRRALLVVDVQRDFCEGGALAVAGGHAVAAAITAFVARHRDVYEVIVASRDWHRAETSNDGHIALPPSDPDFSHSWPAHAIAGSPGAEPDLGFDAGLATVTVRKGYGFPAYSLFEGSDSGRPGDAVGGQASVDAWLGARAITAVDVVGLATDYCCLATARSALAAGYEVRVLRDLQAGVDPGSSAAALAALAEEGAVVTDSGAVAPPAAP